MENPDGLIRRLHLRELQVAISNQRPGYPPITAARARASSGEASGSTGRPRPAHVTNPAATNPHPKNPRVNGRTVPSKARSSIAPNPAPSAVEIVPITAAAVPASFPIGFIAIVLKLGMSSACMLSMTARPETKNQKSGAPFVAMARVRELIKFLASKEANEVWASAEKGAVISPNTQVSLDLYAPLTRLEAEGVLGADILVFDGSDLADPAIGGDAMFTGLQDFIDNPDDIMGVLEFLESVAAGTR